MNDNLIKGVNPYQITYIVWGKFRRFDYHPYYNRLARRKFPILSRIPLINWFILRFDDNCSDSVWPAYVHIKGNGRVLYRIACKSNAEAESLCAQLNKELDDFVKATKTQIGEDT